MDETLTTMDRIRRMSDDERQQMAKDVFQSLSKRYSNVISTVGMDLEEGFASVVPVKMQLSTDVRQFRSPADVSGNLGWSEVFDFSAISQTFKSSVKGDDSSEQGYAEYSPKSA